MPMTVSSSSCRGSSRADTGWAVLIECEGGGGYAGGWCFRVWDRDVPEAHSLHARADVLCVGGDVECILEQSAVPLVVGGEEHTVMICLGTTCLKYDYCNEIF